MAEAKSTASIWFEKQIWDVACVLRRNIEASKYKSVVLGLIFLKYISDRFEEDIDENASEGIFFVPPTARWSEIAAKAHTPKIGTVIDDAMRSMEKENKRCIAQNMQVMSVYLNGAIQMNQDESTRQISMTF